MKIRQINIFKILAYLISDKKATNKRHGNFTPNTLLIIRTDAIGDYVLFRNFLEELRISEKFKGFKITLCGNEIWKDITEEFDSKYIDETIWIQRNRFKDNREYRDLILSKINTLGFEYAIETSTSRELLIGDAIIKASNALYRIAKLGDSSNTNALWKLISDQYYTKLFDVSNHVFEFDSNKYFFELVLGANLQIENPFFKIASTPKESIIILFPGASERTKQWPTEHFSVIANYLISNSAFKIIIAGAESDNYLALDILKKCNPTDRIMNLCGKTNLPELINLISKATLLISSDTSAFHIGLSTKTKSIGLFDGRHFGRFAPYPNFSKKEAIFLYPPPIDDYSLTFLFWIKQNKIKNTGYSIKDIKPEKVIESIIYLL